MADKQTVLKNVRNATEDMPPLIRAVLIERFGNTTLAYHNDQHIFHMMNNLDRFYKPRLSDRDYRVVRYAIWMHDAYYSTTVADNERRSANLALALLEWPEDEMNDLEICIMATKGHATDHPLARIVVDLDLAILAEDRERYRQYALDIRSEYARYADADYRAGRVERVLKPFCTYPLLHDLSEAMGLPPIALQLRAYSNMQWEIACLESDASTVEEALMA